MDEEIIVVEKSVISSCGNHVTEHYESWSFAPKDLHKATGLYTALCDTCSGVDQPDTSFEDLDEGRWKQWMTQGMTQDGNAVKTTITVKIYSDEY